ncbi:MAG: carboxypeptidase-like regulatory domain-containing protein [Lachnospiraceae bacterium]|nr:carboxypeptidase-like regulatory domain-containing protein [Lachnospiraceae bacterium]
MPILIKNDRQDQAEETGALRVDVVNEREEPVAGAEILVFETGEPEQVLTKSTTDVSGQTDVILLDAPPLIWSLEIQNDRQPYSEYNIRVTAPGYEDLTQSR